MKFNAKDPQSWISRDLFESYCGSDSERLLSYYDKAVQKKNIFPWSMNWFAFFFFPAWLGYKKQWQTLSTLAAIFAALPFVKGYLGLSHISSSSLIGICLAMSFMANGMVLMSANSIFIKLNKRGMDMEQIRSRLKDRACSSIASAIVGAVLFVLVQFAAAIVAGMIFGLPA
jgi:hypothetical protein